MIWNSNSYDDSVGAVVLEGFVIGVAERGGAADGDGDDVVAGTGRYLSLDCGILRV